MELSGFNTMVFETIGNGEEDKKAVWGGRPVGTALAFLDSKCEEKKTMLIRSHKTLEHRILLPTHDISPGKYQLTWRIGDHESNTVTFTVTK